MPQRRNMPAVNHLHFFSSSSMHHDVIVALAWQSCCTFDITSDHNAMQETFASIFANRAREGVVIPVFSTVA